MHRRSLLLAGLAAGCSLPGGRLGASTKSRSSSAATTTEVIGDGKWIWTRPPAGETGYLEPRPFEFRTSIRLRGAGAAVQVKSATAVPVELPEQKIDDVTIRTSRCAATFRQVGPAAGQMVVAKPSLQSGEVAVAEARFRLTLLKQFFNYQKEQFPVEQQFPKDFAKQYLYNSPGIQTRSREVRDLSEQLAGNLPHPWDKAHVFKQWVWEHIKSDSAMRYTGVANAIRSGVGDCEERAAVFAALCRLQGIPTRTVWVPNHVWAEFCLLDHEGQGHWIPAHTSGYTWFGLTGAHELILQKGDGVRDPDQRREMRFLHDWLKFTGTRPEVQYTAELQPLPPQPSADAGPGARIKAVEGPWTTGSHPLDQYLLNGESVKESPFHKNKSEVEPWE